MSNWLIVGDGRNNRDFIDTPAIYQYRKNVRELAELEIALGIVIIDVKDFAIHTSRGYVGYATRHHPVFLHCVQKRTSPFLHPAKVYGDYDSAPPLGASLASLWQFFITEKISRTRNL